MRRNLNTQFGRHSVDCKYEKMFPKEFAEDKTANGAIRDQNTSHIPYQGVGYFQDVTPFRGTHVKM